MSAGAAAPELWPPVKHAKFEAALKANPKVNSEPGDLRWQRVATAVGQGSSAAECQSYFRVVREHIKQRQQRTTGATPVQHPAPQPEPQRQRQRQPQPKQQQRNVQTYAPAAPAAAARRPPAAAAKDQTMRPMSSRVVSKWWQRLDDAEDPISLEPIAELNYPPFELLNEAASEVATCFDGRVLAHYLVSTGNFKHPITRRDLTGKECRNLDAYLKDHKLGPGRVEEAWKRREEYTKDEQGRVGVLGLQAEASALLQALFMNSDRPAAAASTYSGGGSGGGGRPVVVGGGQSNALP